MIISKKKINVAILDDYQNVSHTFANWDKLSKEIELDVFNEYIGKEKNLSNILFKYDVLCLMRERTPLPEELIDKLPNLKLVITSGMWNASVDVKALKRRNIIFCGTDTKVHSTAELAWALIMKINHYNSHTLHLLLHTLLFLNYDSKQSLSFQMLYQN